MTAALRAGPTSSRSRPELQAALAFGEAIRGLTEAMLLVRPDGTIVTTNAAGRSVVGSVARLSEALAAGVEDLPAYLRRCSGSVEALPGLLSLKGDGGPRPFRCDGALYRPDPEQPPLLRLQLRPREGAAQTFVELTRQVDALNREVAARRRTVEALAQAVADRDGLLRELHHRVRNTVQLFIALLRAAATCDGLPPAGLERLVEQFHAVGFVQKQMTDATDMQRIDLNRLLRDLAAFLEPPPPAAGFRLRGDAPSLRVEQATPLAILLARFLSGTGAPSTGGRGIEVSAAKGMTIRVAVPGSEAACRAMIAEEVVLLLAQQVEAQLRCDRREGIWNVEISLSG